MNNPSESRRISQPTSSTEAINDETVDFHLHDIGNSSSNPVARQSPDDDSSNKSANNELPPDPSTLLNESAAQMIYADFPSSDGSYGSKIHNGLKQDEGHAKEAYQEVLVKHEEVLKALDSLTDPSILSEKFVWGDKNDVDQPVIHRTLEIEILNAMSRGDAHTVYELTAEVQKSFIKTHDNAQSERNLRYLSVQALAFFTQVLLNLGISVDLAFFLLDFFNKQINALRSANSLLAYQHHMLQVYLNQVQKHKERNYSPPIQRAVNYVRQNTKQCMTLGQIAKHAEVHPNYLSQKFSQEVGVTLSQFIGNERMSSIKSYLVETDIPLSDIAKRFNFSSNSYFSTYFRKHTNMSPSRYRKEHRKF